MKHHKIISFIMGIFGIISLSSSYNYGFDLSLDFSIESAHNISGFISFILSLSPFAIVYIFKKNRLHHSISYTASVFAAISLITGFIAYFGILLNYFIIQISDSCLVLDDLKFSDKCLVAVDNVVYDMSSMPRWQTRIHYDYNCGGNYSKEYIISIMPSHVQSKYYGPVYGYLCE